MYIYMVFLCFSLVSLLCFHDVPVTGVLKLPRLGGRGHVVGPSQQD